VAELQAARGQVDASRRALLRAEQLLLQVVAQDPSNRGWQMDVRNVRLKILDLDSGAGGQQARLARLDMLEKAFAALRALEPKKSDLLRLVALTEASQASAHLSGGDAVAAKVRLRSSVASLEAQYAQLPSDAKIRDALMSALLLQSDIERSGGEGAAARLTCRHILDLLPLRAADSLDFRVLAPWVRAQFCTGDASRTLVQQQRLAAMAYREAAYLRAVSSYGSKKGEK
jgi:hypothetical protein